MICVGVSFDQVHRPGGNDVFRNNSVPSGAVRRAGNDQLIGGSVDDRLFGGTDTDEAIGNGGFDTCAAETESGCEA